jgi:hypothetical protein
MNKEELEKTNLVLKYIDFQAICEDYDLDEGGLAPEQLVTFKELLIEFILQNKYSD